MLTGVGEDEAVAMLLERAHDEEAAEKEDQALGRRKFELLGVRTGPNGICKALKGCTKRTLRRR